MFFTKQIDDTQAATRQDLADFDKRLPDAIANGANVETLANERQALVDRIRAYAAITEAAKVAETQQADQAKHTRRVDALQDLYDINKEKQKAWSAHEKNVKQLRETLAKLEELHQKAIIAQGQAQIDFGSIINPMKVEWALLRTYLVGHDYWAETYARSYSPKIDPRKALDK